MRNNYYEDDIVESLEDGKKYYITEIIPENSKELFHFLGNEYVLLRSKQLYSHEGVIAYLKIRVRLYKRPIKNWIKWIFLHKKNNEKANPYNL